MKKYLKEREEAIKLLNLKGFKYYVPRKCEALEIWSENKVFYYIEVNDNTGKIEYCSTVAIENDCICREVAFYDCDKAYKSRTKEQGELRYKERLEYLELIRS